MTRTSYHFDPLAEQQDTRDDSDESPEDVRNDLLVDLSLIGLLLLVALGGIAALLILG